MASFSTANAHIVKRVVSLDVPSIGANTVSAETFTVAGLRTDMFPLVVKPTADAGLVPLAARVSASNTLEIIFWNATGSAINAAAQDFYLVCL